MHEHKLLAVMGNGNVNLLRNFTKECDNINEARRPDIISVLKKDSLCIIDISISGDVRIVEKEKEKESY